MRILVCGGRDFGNMDRKLPEVEFEKRRKQYAFIFNTLDKLARKHSKHYNPDDNWLPSDIVIISGGAKGADEAAACWAIVNWIEPEIYKANWFKFKKVAGLVRNQQMLKKGKPDLVVAFPGGRGTNHMVGISKKAGVEVLELEYNDNITI